MIISYNRLVHILQNKLHIRQLFTRWVLHLIKQKQKCIPVQTPVGCLQVFERNSTDFKQRFITIDLDSLLHITTQSTDKTMYQIL